MIANGMIRLTGKRILRRGDVSGSVREKSLSVSTQPRLDRKPSNCWHRIVYISGRPFVLRDGSAPKTTMALSDRAENLEGIERRMKDDILQESKR
jgi:hypothetical protein